MQLIGTHQLLAYTDGVNRCRGNIHTIKENAEALIVTSKEIGLEVNADKTKYSHVSHVLRSACRMKPQYEEPVPLKWWKSLYI
jgi:hypothetical protein